MLKNRKKITLSLRFETIELLRKMAEEQNIPVGRLVENLILKEDKK